MDIDFASKHLLRYPMARQAACSACSSVVVLGAFAQIASFKASFNSPQSGSSESEQVEASDR